MLANPLLGVFYHWLGGLASASFYVPYKRVQGWAWEVYWLAGGIFSWVLAPWTFATLRTEHLWIVLSSTPPSTLFWCWFWGILWGFGGLTFGLTMRYLGMSLGMAIILGLTMILGTLGPPIFHGTLAGLATSAGGRISFLGIALAMAGILVVSRAGLAKEKEIPATETLSSISEYNFSRGLVIALFSGVMSSCFAFGLDAGAPIRALTLQNGTSPISQGLPVLCVVLMGGFTTNFVWCLYLLVKNRTAREFIGALSPTAENSGVTPPLARNYSLCALAGLSWYFQFFFYTMGESQMGAYGFSSWTLHMASIIIFGTAWGFVFKEWAQASRHTTKLVWVGVASLVLATVIIGIGNYWTVRE